MGAHEEGAIHIQLAAGHGEEGGEVGEVGEDVAQAAGIARGVLEADDGAFAGEGADGVSRQFGVDADGEVVGDDGGGGGFGDIAEVVHRLWLAGAGVERGGDDDAVDAQGCCAFGVADDAIRGGVYHAGEDGEAAGGDLYGVGEDAVSGGFVVEDDFAGGAEEEQAVDAAGDEMLDDAGEAGVVHRVIGVERGDDGGDDAAQRIEVLRHGRILPGVGGADGRGIRCASESWA